MLENEKQRRKQYEVRKWLAQQLRPQTVASQYSELAAGESARRKSLESIALTVEEFPAMLEYYTQWRKTHPGQKWSPDLWLNRSLSD